MAINALKIICFLFLFTPIGVAQDSYSWRLTDKEGLPSMEIYHLYQDTKGYMWIATDRGLCRYDGLSIKRYQHPDQKGNAVANIKEDEEGRIWFKAFSGQLFYIDQQGDCQLFPIPKEYHAGTYYAYTLREKELCLGTDRLCIYNFETQEWRVDSFPNIGPSTSSQAISNLEADAEGNLLFVTYKQEFWLQSDTINEKITVLKDWSSCIPFAKDSVILFQPNTNSLIYIDVIDRFRTDTSTIDHFSVNQRVLAVYKDKDLIWVATMKGAFGYERKSTGGWQQKYHILPDEQVSVCRKDKEGNYWFATLQNGIFIFPSLDIKFYNAQNSSLTNGHLLCVEKDAEGQLLIGGSDGAVMRFDPTREQLSDHYAGVEGNILSIVFDKKREKIYFTSYGLQVAEWKNSKSIVYLGATLGGGHNSAIYKEDFLLSGKNGFVGLMNLRGGLGVDSIPPNSFNFRYKKAWLWSSDEIPYPAYIHVLQNLAKIKAIWVDQKDPDYFWLAANDSLYMYGGRDRKIILDEAGNSIVVTDINQTVDGAIWCTTMNKGLYKIVDHKVTKVYTEADGLPTNNCLSLTTDSMTVWVGTELGIVKLNTTDNKIDVYNDLDGCVSNEIRDIEVVDGKVWATTIKGLISFDVNIKSINPQKPFIELIALEINKKAHSLGTAANLLYNENNLKFKFQATAFKGLDRIHYEYRLLGLDSAWIQLPRSTDFTYFQGLIPGDFIFEVRAVNEDGFVSEKPARYAFSIQPPYWQTYWFLFLMYTGIVLFVGGIATFRYRVYKRERDLEASMSRMRMQALQSQMNPHFVFNAMSAIQDYWIQQEPKIALMYQAKFAKLMRLIFAYSKELGIHIEEELEFLKIYVSLEQIRFEGQVEVIFDVEETLLNQEIYLTPLLIQPQLENCFKHGLLHKEGKGKILIQLKKEASYIYCAIEDDGVGRKKAGEYASWRKHFKKKVSSLDITTERLQILNDLFGVDKTKKVLKISDLETTDGKATGTLVEMWIPQIIL
ncbi:sensor histidine kinase [Aureispira anguillae]|uniref:Histidine kinase n=1 Tax=Aureispira anguillae TaxID=2864201 RepID=A0A915YBB6_9BACT|nr:two-component regulator propeller domain-containing protein [Aureispira anguillae]BDS09932.1 histidine kinase [Aureispira anguillae]